MPSAIMESVPAFPNTMGIPTAVADPSASPARIAHVSSPVRVISALILVPEPVPPMPSVLSSTTYPCALVQRVITAMRLFSANLHHVNISPLGQAHRFPMPFFPFSPCSCPALPTLSMWTQFPMPRGQPAGCMLMCVRILWNPSTLSPGVYIELRVCVPPGVCEPKV